VAKLVQKRKYLRRLRVACIRPYLQRANPLEEESASFPGRLRNVCHAGEEGAMWIDRDRRVGAVALNDPCNIRIAEYEPCVRSFGLYDVILTPGVECKVQGTKCRGGIGIFASVPRVQAFSD